MLYGHAPGMAERVDEVVGRGLAGRVWRIGAQRRLLGKHALGTERAVNFIGRDLEEPLDLLVASCFEQRQRADDIGVDEDLGPRNGSIHVTLGGEIDDGLDLMLVDQSLHQGSVADVSVDEDVVLVLDELGEVLEVARVGQLVEIDQQAVRMLREDHLHEVASDETRPTGNQ